MNTVPPKAYCFDFININFRFFKQKIIDLIGKCDGEFFILLDLSSSAKAIILLPFVRAAEALVVPSPPNIPK